VTEAAIAIAMATCEPDRGLFAAQIESLRQQTREDWVCVVSDDCSSVAGFELVEAEVGDDPRFRVSRSQRRLGFYRNFERALTLLPPGPELVALADQDDRWDPGKLATLATGLGSAVLVHSDTRVVTTDGAVISPGYWTRRKPNDGDLAALLTANTVTGAASLFRRQLLERALPFPEVPGRPYHDHWLALVALASGEIAFIDEPLYDYVQHGGAVLGHVGGGRSGEEGAYGTRRQRWRRAYEEECRRVLGFATALEERCGPLPDRDRQHALERMLATRRSPLALAWLAGRGVRDSFGRSETGCGERTLLAGLAWYWLARASGYDAERGSQR
jgi:Glycosyl transferase family 2